MTLIFPLYHVFLFYLYMHIKKNVNNYFAINSILMVCKIFGPLKIKGSLLPNTFTNQSVSISQQFLYFRVISTKLLDLLIAYSITNQRITNLHRSFINFGIYFNDSTTSYLCSCITKLECQKLGVNKVSDNCQFCDFLYV